MPSPPAAPGFGQAFEALYTAGFHPLYTYLDRLTGDPALAADVAQDAYMRLHARGAVPENPTAWIVAVAHNLLRDVTRKRRRQLRLLTADPIGVPTANPPPPPDAAVLADEHRRLVRAALERLPIRDRQLLLLRHAGYSYREIATAIDVKEGSVGTLLVRATAAFRRSYEDRHASD
jgi:RNA polymerase sigma-70 factor (ECF subfamily)